MNHKDHQAHSLMDSPVFYTDRIRRFYSWEELIEADPPSLIHYPDRPLCVCEEGNIWPISNNIAPDIQDRQMQFKEFHQDAEQNAVAGATRQAAIDTDGRAWSIVSMAVFLIVSAVLVLIALQSDLVGSFWPGAAAGMALFGRRRNKEPKARKPHYRQWETVRVYDEVAGHPWTCSMPLQILTANLPPDCRYTQEIGVTRLWGAALFGGGIALSGVMLFWGAGIPTFWSIAAPILAASPLGLWGWKKGYQIFMQPPRWIVRRLYARREIEAGKFALDYDSLPEIVPEVHTKLAGIPIEEATMDRRLEAEEVARQALSGSKNGNQGTLTRLNLAVAYTPRIFRSYMLYEFLLGRDIRARAKGPRPKTDHVKQVTRAGLAFGALALLAALIFFS